MIKYISIFWMMLRCLLAARKKNLTGFSTGLTGQSKNLDPTGNPTGFHLWHMSRMDRRFTRWIEVTARKKVYRSKVRYVVTVRFKN